MNKPEDKKTVRKSTPVQQGQENPGLEVKQERYRRIIAEVRDFGIFIMDEQGRITDWNAGAETIFGYPSSEALGQSGEIIFTPEERAEGAAEQEKGQAAATGRAEDERWHIRKNGSRLWASGVMTALRDNEGGPPWYVKIVRDLTERRLHEQREHTLTLQLQAAVQPAAPPSLPGIAIRSFYRPAHKELAIGGDFFDAFGLGDGRSALAAGDVSGKGIEAATQVATVRNMLRYAIYNYFHHSGMTLAVSITDLNRTLTEHGLLAGFITLFAGVFDPETSALTYVNCGQEAALVRRAVTGQVEALRFTGPIMGIDMGAEYREEQVTLSPGDALVVFTDGLTDIGPNRGAMLGEDGVTTLFQGPIPDLDGASAQRAADLLVSRLIKAVDAQGPENVPDDLCVLVAVTEATLSKADPVRI